MSQKSSTSKPPAEAVVREIRRATRRHYSAEDKIRIVLEGLRGEHSISELCRREGIAESMVTAQLLCPAFMRPGCFERVDLGTASTLR